MIIGIGSDLIDIRRIEAVLARHGERFLKRIYTDAERAKAAKRARLAPHPLAGGAGGGLPNGISDPAVNDPIGTSPPLIPPASGREIFACPAVIAHYAKRFAAKEACCKALGTGINQGVYFKDMGVVNLPSGQPTLQLTGTALKRLQSMTPPGMKTVIHLTITDEPPLAQAFVVIEAV